MKIAITFAALAAASAVSFGAQTVFVAPGGSDSEGLGTKEKPFASLNRAIREFYSSKPGDFEICVAEGEYFFSKGVSIVAQHTNGKTLSIAGPNFSGEPKARFIGGIKIPAKYLEKVSDKETLSKIPQDAEGVLYKIDLKKFGVSEVGKVEKRGWGSWKTNGNPLETEAFFNRSPMTPARYPNDDSLLKIGEVLDTGKVTDFAASDSYEQEDKSVRGATFKYDFDRPSRWLGAPDAYLRGNFSVGWAYDQIKIKKIDPAAKTITLADPHAYGVRSNTPPKGSRLYVDKADLKVRGYQAFNLIEELDRVGEYYIDRKNLVFYTMLASAPKEGDAFYFSLAPDPIITMWNASNVKIRNIEFAVTRNSPIKGSYCNGVEIDKCAFRSCGKPFALDGVSYKKPEEKDCATFVSKNNKITNCKFFDNAMGGARIGGGNKRNLEKSNVLVYNCDFRRNALRLTVGGSALSISGVGVRVANCHISDQRQATALLPVRERLRGDIHILKFRPNGNGNTLQFLHEQPLRTRIHGGGVCGRVARGGIGAPQHILQHRQPQRGLELWGDIHSRRLRDARGTKRIHKLPVCVRLADLDGRALRTEACRGSGMAQKPCGRRNRRIPEGISQTCADSRPDSPARKLRLRQQNFQFLNGDERAAEALRELIHKARLGIGRGRNQEKPEFVHRGREKVLRFRSARKAHSRPQNRARKRSVLRRIVFWGNRAPQIPRRARFFSKNILKLPGYAALLYFKFFN